MLLFSDNHRDRNSIKQIIRKNPKSDLIISLGDSEMRIHELQELNVQGVKGNYPFEPDVPKELNYEFFDLKLYMTHGHHFSVKMGLTRLLNYAIYNEINIVCFGHTHRPLIKEIESVLFINPGSTSRSKMHRDCSYAVLEIDDKEIKAIVKTLSGKILYEYMKLR